MRCLNASSFLVGALAVVVTTSVSAQAPAVPDLITALTSARTDVARWQAARSLGASAFVDAAERDSAVAALKQALSSSEAGLRVNAASALGALSDAGSVPALDRALPRCSTATRWFARRLRRLWDALEPRKQREPC